MPAIMSASAAPVDTLPDSLLTKIFSYLPFKDRYLLCLVSSKWVAAARIPWSDITFLNLNSIPRAMANPILDLCPKVREIEAKNHTIILGKETVMSMERNVHTMKLRDVTFDTAGHGVSLLSAYFGQFPNLAELTMHNTRLIHTTQSVCASGMKTWQFVVPQMMAASLRRLILANMPDTGTGDLIAMALRETQNLECLYLVDNLQLDYCLFGLPELRELFLVSKDTTLSVLAAGVVCGKFPKLEVLIYASRCHVDPKSVGQLIVMSELRILVIAGLDRLAALLHSKMQAHQAFIPAAVAPAHVFTIDARQARVGSAAGSSIIPLQIFVGGDFTKHFAFKLPSPDVAKFWRIDCPMPEYLAKSDVAPMFEGVWAAKIIREGPAKGLLPWGSPGETHLFYSKGPLMFC